MDGTLTQGEQFLPALLETLRALAAADIAVVIVTGRSAGWVQGLVHYLPVVGAIAENGGLYLSAGGERREWLVPVTPVAAHRQRLSALFEQIQTRYPHLQPSSDNDFRLTDWTFDVAGLTAMDLAAIATLCQGAGWGFTYSTVQCHLRLHHQDKGAGLTQVIAQHFPALSPPQVVTVGDSPNDAELFDPSRFPLSVGVANVAAYRDRLPHQPRAITPAPEWAGFQQVAAAILAAQGHPLP
jgi:HAD superfamily hydrolase (TIGR01484 family)